MLLPIADDAASAPRTSWLTLGWLAACLVCFLAAGGAQHLTGRDDDVELEQAVDYWLEHPYLEPEPEVVEAAAFAAGYTDRVAFVAKVRTRGELPPFDGELLAMEQGGLSYLTRLALRGSDTKPGREHPSRRFGLVASAPQLHAFLTHPFLHAGWLHLGLTLLLIWLVTPALEGRLGVWLTAGIGLAGAFVSALTQLLIAPNATAPLIGATGIAAALLGAFSVRFGTRRVHVRYLALQSLRPVARGIDAPGWAPLALGVAVQVGLCLLFLGDEVEAGNAWIANLAALATGGAVAFALQHLRLEERLAVPGSGARAKLDSRVKRAVIANEGGHHAEAIALADEVLRERPDDLDALQESWTAHVAAGRTGDGARAGRRLVELHARRGDLASAARLWDELMHVAHRGRVEPTTLLRIVPELMVQARRDAAIAALRAVIDPSNKTLTVGQALRVAELGSEIDPPTALQAARFALERGQLVEERRARVEQLAVTLEQGGARVKAPESDRPTRVLDDAPADAESETATDLDFELGSGLSPEMLGEADESSTDVVESAPPPSELFELEPTQLGVEPQAAPEALRAPIAAPPVAASPIAAPPIATPPVAAPPFSARPITAPPAAAKATSARVTPPPAAPVSAPVSPVLVEEGFATVLYTAPAPASSASLKVTPATPVALDVAGLRVRFEGGAPSLIEWTRIQAVAVGLVSGLGPNPVVVIDLVLNWAETTDGALELMRLRSDAFRARQLVIGANTALEALRTLLAELLARSGGVPLPEPAGARGTPFREFASLALFESRVLLANH